jgi:hypothetical protein
VLYKKLGRKDKENQHPKSKTGFFGLSLQKFSGRNTSRLMRRIPLIILRFNPL